MASCIKEKRRLRVFENRILRLIFGTKGDENGELRKLHSEEYRSLYCLSNITRITKFRRWAGYVSKIEGSRSTLSFNK
jgi:hypothetical protein